jgi:DNA (cytosine-5)-methyltransferase 1
MSCRPKKIVIDLFCAEGGISTGYANTGFTVVGVDNDIERLKRYPFSNFLGDWESGLQHYLYEYDWSQIAFIHASPPCQGYTEASYMARARGIEVNYPMLIEPVRERLQEIYMKHGIDYVIENVPSAPLEAPTMLCGSMFSLIAEWKNELVGLKRHRGFETSFPMTAPVGCGCDMTRAVPVYGHGAPGYREGNDFFKGRGFAQLTRDVMGIKWMSRRGLTEAIPPSYGEHVAYTWQALNDQWQMHDENHAYQHVSDAQNAHN